MHAGYKNIIDNDPIVFTEDIYLCTKYGEILTGRYREPLRAKNIFERLEPSEVRFLQKNAIMPAMTPLAFVESKEGTVIFDLSLCPKFGLMIAVSPHLSKNELSALARTELSHRAVLSDSFLASLSEANEIEVSGEAQAFSRRLLSVRRSGEYFSFLLKTNSEAASAMSDIAESIGAFYGCFFDISFGEICDDFEAQNTFCFESFAFSIISLALLARKYSASRSASLKISVCELGVYYDVTFKMAEQYEDEELLRIAPELKNLTTSAADRIFDCFCFQRNGAFCFRGFPWLRMPDSADLKAREEDFIYDD